MKDIFSLIKSDSFNKQLKDNIVGLEALTYDTIISAKSDKTVPVRDYQKVCYDTYHEVTASIKDTLSELKKEYDAKTDTTDVIKAVKLDFEKNVLNDWKYIYKNADKFVNQMFIDSTSERIYSYNASMEVLLLLKKCCEFFLNNEELSKKEKSKLINKIYNKCLDYSKDSLFDKTAGSPMHCMGYTDITNIYDVTNAYGIIVNAISSDKILNTLQTYSKKVINLESEASTLDSLMESNIAKGQAISDTTLQQYKNILSKASALKSIYRTSVVMIGLLSKMQHTVDNLLTNAKYSITSDSLKNVTHDMGMTLTPLIIEEQPIAIEGFVGKILNRIKTAWNDSQKRDLEKYKSVEPFMEFIHEHLDEEDVNNYLSSRRWKGVSLKELESAAKVLKNALNAQSKFISKFTRCGSFLDMFNYPASKQLNIPEIMDLYNACKKVGTDSTVCYQSRYTGDFSEGVSPDKIKNLLKDDNFNVYCLYRDMKFPSLSSYIYDQDKLIKVLTKSSKEIGVSNINDLEKCKNICIENGSYIFNEILPDTPSSADLDKNISSIHENKTRDLTVANYYRTFVWYQYYWLTFGMYAWCAYFPYTIIKDVKKYA